MENILNMILSKESPEKILNFIDEFKNKIKTKFKPEEIALPVSINKPLNQYGNVQHIVASRFANEKHNEGIKSGDKVKMIFIKGEHPTIAFKEHMPKGYEIDYDNMIRRIVDLKIEPIFRSLNWEYNKSNKLKLNVTTSQRTLFEIKQSKDL